MPVTARRYVRLRHVDMKWRKLKKTGVFLGAVTLFTLSRHRRLNGNLSSELEMEGKGNGSRHTHVDENVGAIIFHGSRYSPQQLACCCA